MLMLALVLSAEAVVTPRRLAAQATVAPSISAGSYHTCAIRVYTSLAECWGSNSHGQSTVSPKYVF